ncbi:hypothetical protein HDU67_003862 [Dinochytrium kinnereticum]|nr:hypothetical protein HDU67_003862 [Dinochytrium kinnereticum]
MGGESPSSSGDGNGEEVLRLRLRILEEERVILEKRSELAKLDLAGRLLTTINDVLKPAGNTAATAINDATLSLLTETMVRITGLLHQCSNDARQTESSHRGSIPRSTPPCSVMSSPNFENRSAEDASSPVLGEGEGGALGFHAVMNDSSMSSLIAMTCDGDDGDDDETGFMEAGAGRLRGGLVDPDSLTSVVEAVSVMNGEVKGGFTSSSDSTTASVMRSTDLIDPLYWTGPDFDTTLPPLPNSSTLSPHKLVTTFGAMKDVVPFDAFTMRHENDPTTSSLTMMLRHGDSKPPPKDMTRSTRPPFSSTPHPHNVSISTPLDAPAHPKITPSKPLTQPPHRFQTPGTHHPTVTTPPFTFTVNPAVSLPPHFTFFTPPPPVNPSPPIQVLSRPTPNLLQHHPESTKLPRVHRETPCNCTHCAAPILTAHLFGDAESFAVPYVLDVTCTRCRALEGGEEEEVGGSRRKRRRGGGAGGGGVVECKLCGGVVGWGGVRILGRGQEWVDPAFGWEVVCEGCSGKFRFCTNCGGGGKFRSGKWRPKELFSPTRKNCSLDHTRLRIPKSSRYLVYRLPVKNTGSPLPPSPDPTVFGPPPSQIPYKDSFETLVQDVLEFYAFASLASGAEASMMLLSPWADTWDKFVEWRAMNLVELERLLRGLFDPNVSREVFEFKEYRRYLSLAVSPNPKAKKWKIHNEAGGSVDVLAGGESDYMIVGFSIFNWHVTDRHLFHRFTTCLGQYSLGQGSMIPSLLLSAERRVETDIANHAAGSSILPLHLWAYHFMRKGQSKKNIIPELVRVGFRYMEDYAGSVGLTAEGARELFRNHVMPEEIYNRMRILCLPWAERHKIMASLARHAIAT